MSVAGFAEADIKLPVSIVKVSVVLSAIRFVPPTDIVAKVLDAAPPAPKPERSAGLKVNTPLSLL